MDMKELIQVILRALLSLVTLFLVTKMLGKKQVSQLSLFDYVIGISIGNFAAEMTLNLESHWLHATIAVIIFGLIATIISISTLKSVVLRRYFMGKSTTIMEDGKLLMKSLKNTKFDINDFLEQCREQGYFDISEISYAIMEANGKLSILPKGEHKPLTPKDMNLKKEKSGLCANVIIDGNIMKKNLNNMGKSEDWLINQLNIKGKDIDKLLLATLDIKDTLHFYDKGNISKGDMLD
jgi:Predicted membrane protein